MEIEWIQFTPLTPRPKAERANGQVIRPVDSCLSALNSWLLAHSNDCVSNDCVINTRQMALMVCIASLRGLICGIINDHRQRSSKRPRTSGAQVKRLSPVWSNLIYHPKWFDWNHKVDKYALFYSQHQILENDCLKALLCLKHELSRKFWLPFSFYSAPATTFELPTSIVNSYVLLWSTYSHQRSSSTPRSPRTERFVLTMTSIIRTLGILYALKSSKCYFSRHIAVEFFWVNFI